MKTALLTLSMTLLLACFFGCERENDPVSTDPQQLIGKWQLREPTSDYQTTLMIEVGLPSGGTVSGIYSLKFTGKAPINTYSAIAKLVNSATGSISLDSVATTKIGGPTKAMQFEQAYYSTLGAVTQYELISKNNLRLRYQGGVLFYERIN